jgi:hypothetical protein
MMIVFMLDRVPIVSPGSWSSLFANLHRPWSSVARQLATGHKLYYSRWVSP